MSCLQAHENEERPSAIKGAGHPRIFAPVAGPLLVRLPYTVTDGFTLLHDVCGHRTLPRYDAVTRAYRVARAHLSPLLDHLVQTCGVVDLLREGNEDERCNTSCLQALGDECTCSCGGLLHGVRHAPAGWRKVAYSEKVGDVYRGDPGKVRGTVRLTATAPSKHARGVLARIRSGAPALVARDGDDEELCVLQATTTTPPADRPAGTTTTTRSTR